MCTYEEIRYVSKYGVNMNMMNASELFVGACSEIMSSLWRNHRLKMIRNGLCDKIMRSSLSLVDDSESNANLVYICN